MRRIIATIYTCIITLSLHAQSKAVIDSLKLNIDKYPAKDSFRVKAIYKYLKASVNYNTSGHLPYIQEVLQISRRINYPYGVRRGLNMAVQYFGDRGDYATSFAYGDTMLAYTKNDTSYDALRDRGVLQSSLGNNYHRMGDYIKAIEYNIQAAELFNQMHDTLFTCLLYTNISDIYSRMNDTVKTTEYTLKALHLAENWNNDELTVTTLLSYSADLATTGRYKETNENLERAWPLIQKLDNTSFKQSYHHIKGTMEQRRGNYSTAVPLLKRALVYAYINDDVHQITGTMESLYRSLNGLNQLPEAKKYLDSTLLLATQSDLKMRRKNAYDGFADWYEKKGDFKNANEFLKKASVLNDSLISDENKKQIASLEVRYQVTVKENEIRSLKAEKEIHQLSIRQKNILNYIFIGSTILLLLISLLLYRNYRQKQKIQQQRISELEIEKKLTATEAVLKGEEQERTRLAKDLHDGLGGMLSGIKYSLNTMKGNLIMTPENQQAFERSMDMLNSSIKEMRRVAHNMMPEALVKFGLDAALKDFCNDIDLSGILQITYQSTGLDDSIDQTTSITIYRIVQELLNNTIKHAAAKTALVQVNKTGSQISITVEDDGKGFNTSVLQQSRGIGWSNIQSRVDFLKGKLDVQSQPGKGTSVFIELGV